ncbi:MAG: 7-cyano-7-deazaguanine synthase [Candidatus Omnitrophica bacterium]|nr:7-cyano-7-deazaguanine synthase [Candidatus Omnitrophota bacterium]
MSTRKKIAVLASGGLDSAILIDHLLKQGGIIHPIYIQNGHVWEKAELIWLKRFLKSIHRGSLKPLIVLSLPTRDIYQTHWSMTGKNTPGAKTQDEKVYLPGKNILLIAKAAVCCALKKIPNLALGPLKSNPFSDAKPSFFKSLEKACREGLNYRLRIHAPFLSLSKKEVMKLGRSLPLDLTFSCLAPKGLKHCGKCNKCAERKAAFHKAGLTDLTSYFRSN